MFPGKRAQALLKAVIGGTIDIDHVAAHWDELLRLATSIRIGPVTGSMSV
ncbi:Tn3 family transposase [Mesorhizobium sp. M0045]